jgi:hypothetical protein
MFLLSCGSNISLVTLTSTLSEQPGQRLNFSSPQRLDRWYPLASLMDAKRQRANRRRSMLSKLSRVTMAMMLGAATLALHAETASSQAPRPRSDRTFEFGEGRALPYYVPRSGSPTERFQFYRHGWWYEEPWWLGSKSYGDGSNKAFRVYGSGPIADPYPVEQQNFSAKKPLGF